MVLVLLFIREGQERRVAACTYAAIEPDYNLLGRVWVSGWKKPEEHGSALIDFSERKGTSKGIAHVEIDLGN